MNISEVDFNAYRSVQFSGVTNMMDVKMVQELSGLTRTAIMDIMANYGDLEKEYGEFEE